MHFTSLIFQLVLTLYSLALMKILILFTCRIFFLNVKHKMLFQLIKFTLSVTRKICIEESIRCVLRCKLSLKNYSYFCYILPLNSDTSHLQQLFYIFSSKDLKGQIFQCFQGQIRRLIKHKASFFFFMCLLLFLYKVICI